MYEIKSIYNIAATATEHCCYYCCQVYFSVYFFVFFLITKFFLFLFLFGLFLWHFFSFLWMIFFHFLALMIFIFYCFRRGGFFLFVCDSYNCWRFLALTNCFLSFTFYIFCFRFKYLIFKLCGFWFVFHIDLWIFIQFIFSSVYEYNFKLF